MSITSPNQGTQRAHRYEFSYVFLKDVLQCYDTVTKVTYPVHELTMALCNMSLAKFTGGTMNVCFVWSNLVDQNSNEEVVISRKKKSTGQVDVIYRGKHRAEAREAAKEVGGKFTLCWAGLAHATIIEDGKVKTLFTSEPSIIAFTGTQLQNVKRFWAENDKPLTSQFAAEALFTKRQYPVLMVQSGAKVAHFDQVSGKSGFLWKGRLNAGDKQEVFDALVNLEAALSKSSSNVSADVDEASDSLHDSPERNISQPEARYVDAEAADDLPF